jgi:hypothetical protein
MTPVSNNVSRFLAALGVAAMFAQCAGGGPVPQRVLAVETGVRTSIALHQGSRGVLLELQNASAAARHDVYSDRKTVPSLKVITDEELQALLDVLSAQGLFTRAARTQPPNAPELLAVTHGDERYYWPRPTVDDPPALQAFDESRRYVMAVYNSSTAYHTGKLSPKDLETENQRVRAAGEAAKARAKSAGQQQEPPK